MTTKQIHQYGFWLGCFFLIVGCVKPSLVAQTNESRSDSSDFVAERVETLVAELDAGCGGLTVDAEGNIYSADFGSSLGRGGTGGHRIYKITPDGTAQLFCEEMRGASGNAFDTEGNLFQANIGANRICKVTPAGNVSVFSAEGLHGPVGVAVDAEGNLLVCNCNGGSIQKITRTGESKVFVRSTLLRCPNGIALDDEENIYVSNFSNGDVIKITPAGEASKLATLPGNNNGHLMYFQGSLLVVARSDHRIYRVSLKGDIEVFAGTGKRGKDDGSPDEATFSFPNAIDASPDGKYLYVNENGPITGSGRVLAPTRIRRIILSEN